MNEEEAKALFLLAGFEVTRLHRLENMYWPEAYVEERRRSPWWLAITQFGPIRIGWRKRVISIEWEDTKARVLVTDDNTTKETTYVHAWSYVKALEYLTALAAAQIAASTAVSENVPSEQRPDADIRVGRTPAGNLLRVRVLRLRSFARQLEEGLRSRRHGQGERDALQMRAHETTQRRSA